MSAARSLVMSVAVLALVWPAGSPRASSRLAGTEWRIVEIDGAKVVGGGTLRFTQSTVRGKADCNAFFGAFREKADAIEIAGLNTTRMACAGRTEAEQSVLSGLERAKSYRVDGNGLLLIDGDGKPLLRLSE